MTESASPHYELVLLQERNSGTFARVYLAEARSRDGIERIVAVKVLKDQWSEHGELLTRTRDEARLLARLHHRNILRVEALTEIDGQPAIVMEFVDGVDLGQLSADAHAQSLTIPPRATYRICADVASALHAAYFRVPFGASSPLKVVHRDVKPSNIMLSVEGEVKVLDFGTARFNSDARAAKTGALRFGSMKYMAPERRRGERGDHPSDVYALGLLLLEALLGSELPLLPLEHTEHDTALARHLASIPALDLPNAEWEASLKQTITAMCAYSPAQRIDAGQAVELLRAFANQASGATLETFASQRLPTIAARIHGQAIDGDLSGSRLFVGLPSTGVDKDERPADPTSPLTNFGVESPRAQTTAPLTQTDSQTTDRIPDTTQDNTAPLQSQQPERLASETLPASTVPVSRWDRRALGAGVLLGVMAVFIPAALALTGSMIWTATTHSESPPAGLASSNSGPPPVSAPEAGSGHTLSIQTADRSIRWVRVTSAADERVLSVREQGSAQLASGAYTVRAKMAGRPEATAALTLDRSLALSCAPKKKGRVVCSSSEGDTLTLKPSPAAKTR